MISQILNFLFEQSEFPSEHDDYVVNVIVREPVLIHIFFKGGANYFVKAAKNPTNSDIRLYREFVLNETVAQENAPSSIQRIGREYNALFECSEIYPELVPVPIFFRESDHNVILVTQGIKHTVVNLENILQARPDFRHQLQQFLIGKERVISTDGREPYDQVLVFEQALSFLPQHLLENIQKIRLAHDWDTMLARLPVIPQHGDLALNNIGLTNTAFVLFDWEDYAYTKLPGFDLCILLVSGSGFDASKLTALIDDDSRQSKHHSFLQPIMSGLGLNVSQLHELMLIHLVIFHQLKCHYGYSPKIIATTLNMLEQLIKGRL